MKALIITEDSIISSKIKAIAEGYGLDTIIYKWFLKALDNIEEIQPDVIILNSSEYPRLWKKYTELGITGCFNQLTKEALNFLDKKAPKTEEELPAIGTLLLCETDKGRMISGKVNKIEDKTLVCTLDFPSTFDGPEISVLTTFINNQIDDYDGALIKKIDNQKNQLILEIQ